ncbi:uncharacterized protein [Prorops nasuta]|uniref:uncharacterized protein n=1 Tax=Prorops nasuta TaxID=863751 RepID=UPI0034CD1961
MIPRAALRPARDVSVLKCDAIAMIVNEDTVIGHDRPTNMEAILARDQRTTSHRVLDRYCDSTGKATASVKFANLVRNANTNGSVNVRESSSGGALDGTTRTTKTRTATFRDITHRATTYCQRDSCSVPTSYVDRGLRSRGIARSDTATTWLRLGSLLVTLLVVSVNSAPIMNPDRRMSSPPKWVNPCGLAADDFEGELDVVQLKDEQLLNQVVVQAKTALMHAQLFRDDYIRRTFNTDFSDLHSTWKDNHYDWLPGPEQIPKKLGEQLDQEFLDRLELDTTLLDAYEYMQRYAVGLEQIVWDQEDHQLEFRKHFKDTEFKLRTVLCELQVALVERGVPLRPDVTREAMTAEYRNMSNSETYRNLRDWLIFRDYMNGLEYVVQVFEHLGKSFES